MSFAVWGRRDDEDSVGTEVRSDADVDAENAARCVLGINGTAEENEREP